MRYTNSIPSQDELRKINTWEYCYDEEGVDDQDESTIRPQLNDGIVNEETAAVSVKITAHNGETCLGLLWLAAFDIESLKFTNSSGSWALHKEYNENHWTTSQIKWGFDFSDFISPNLDNDKLFPLRVDLICKNILEMTLKYFVIQKGGDVGETG